MKLELAVLAAFFATSLSADEFHDALAAYHESRLAGFVSDTALVAAINEQNARTMGYTQSEIDDLDTRWRAEIGVSDRPTIDSVVENGLAGYLRDVVDGADGAITEIFVMDARGLNVAASAPTSDYWQGDEDKHSMTYGAGAGAVHISEIEFDESSQTYQGQVSMTVVDPATGQAIGAVTFGIDPEAVM